jgi:membrane protease subunit HflK
MCSKKSADEETAGGSSENSSAPLLIAHKALIQSGMERLGGIFDRITLAMAGKRNPWGAPGGSGGSGDGTGDGPDDATSGEGGTDAPPPASEGDKPRGPRNPWLPGGGSGESSGEGDKPRRSASIDDIFRNRPGGGQRRTGGGGGPRGPQFRLPERPGGKSWLPVIGVAVAGLWLALSSTHFVQAREQGIVTWFGGKYSHTLQPGTNFTYPWPINMVDVENVSQVRRETIPEGDEEKLVLTADQNLVNLSYIIRWNINDLAQYRFQLADPNDTLREVAEATMRAAVAEQNLDNVLTGDGRSQIEGQARTQMQARLDAFRSGINILGIDIVKADAPNQVIEAFNAVLAARQEAERDLNDARRYEQQVLAAAQGEAAAFDRIYAEYALAPEVTRRRLYYETMEAVLANTDKTIVGADGVTPFLPLPEMRRRMTGESSAPAPVTGRTEARTGNGGQ